MLNMAQQRVSLILGDDTDTAQTGINTVGEGKIDDAETATKIDGGLGSSIG